MRPNAFNTKMTTWTPQRDAELCDLVAEDRYSFGRIAEIMGLSRNQVTSRFSHIRRGMGWQAT